jgi:unsaturated rhamnogalacturonyl hydrolase
MKWLIVLSGLVIVSCSTVQTNRVLVTVKRNSRPIPKISEHAVIQLPISELNEKLPPLKSNGITVTDQHFGKNVPSKIVDTNGDGKADYLQFAYEFKSNEPVWGFMLQPAKETMPVQQKPKQPETTFTYNVLTQLPVYELKHGITRKFSEKIIQSTLNLYPDIKLFPIYAPHRWNYEYSYFLLNAYHVGKQQANDTFVSYARTWIDNFISDTGFREGVYDMREYKLDDVIPARLAILFHQQTGLPKYKAIADTLALQLERQPKTSDGGYWHKQVYPYQMWLDGVFMADVFAMQYAQAYNKPVMFDEAVHQIQLMYKHAFDPATGLLYHGWDESKNPVWAHPEKGTSPEFWGRAVGWYAMALIDCLDYLPADHPERDDVIEIFQEVAAGILNVQYPENHLWYQVLNKANQPGNWIETSCSAMFAYSFAKGHRKGYLDEVYKQAAQRAYDALLKDYIYVDDAGNIHLDQTVKIGTLNPKGSKGDFEYYTTTERRIDDYKGLAALLSASMELKR